MQRHRLLPPPLPLLHAPQSAVNVQVRWFRSKWKLLSGQRQNWHKLAVTVVEKDG